jgi:hypothetical protein
MRTFTNKFSDLMGLAASNERQQQQRQQHEEMSSDGQQLITKILQHSGS